MVDNCIAFGLDVFFYKRKFFVISLPVNFADISNVGNFLSAVKSDIT